MNFFSLSEMGYVERTATLNNIDVEDDSYSSHCAYGPSELVFNFSLPMFQPTCAYNKILINLLPTYNNVSTEPSPLAVIPYSTNVPADHNL